MLFGGGYFHRNALLCESPEALDLIAWHRATKAFTGATCLHAEMGVTPSNPFEQRIKQVAMASSLERFLLVGSHKFNVVQTSYFADLEEFDVVITDTAVGTEFEALIAGSGVRLIKAELAAVSTCRSLALGQVIYRDSLWAA